MYVFATLPDFPARTKKARQIPGKSYLSRMGMQQLPADLNIQLRTPWAFLHPTKELHATALHSAQEYLGSLARSVNGSQSNRKRKRSKVYDSEMLQIDQLYVEGFTSDQVWEQAKRIIDSAGFEIELQSSLNSRGALQRPANFIKASSDDEEDDGAPGDDVHLDHDAHDERTEEDDIRSRFDDTDGDAGLAAEITGESEDEFEKSDDETAQYDSYKEDPFGLNDGFFSIDDFNKQTESFELQDARGRLDGDNGSDEEEVDWHADPLVHDSMAGFEPRKVRRTGHGASESDDAEDGPAFGNADIFADSEEDSDNGENEDAEGNDMGWSNTSGIKYADFFAPPPRKMSKRKVQRSSRFQPNESTVEDDMERAMGDTRRDIFEDDGPIEDDDLDDSSGADTGLRQRSSHERYRARITDEIRRLEAASVAKKEWTLAGEARAADRPVNSLIEEDLEFERTGKPMPVVTNEVSEDIEALVKRRILAKEFDEVIRRRPGVMERAAAPGKAGRMELDDSRPQKGLAELYEADHLRATDPSYLDPREQKLNTEHAAITQLWKDISSQLDILSNWHYKPKAPQASINVVTDTPTVAMEDSRPAATDAAGAVTGTLAPQEIYTPGAAARGEVVSKSGAPVAKGEMSREEKIRRRRQEKEQRKKAKVNVRGDNPRNDRKAEKQRFVSDLDKSGVKVIGKEGEITGVYGNKVRNKSSGNDIGALKL